MTRGVETEATSGAWTSPFCIRVTLVNLQKLGDIITHQEGSRESEVGVDLEDRV